MNVSKLSASAIKSYKFCYFQYLLSYILEMESRSGKSAVLGNVVHKALEWIGLLAKRDKQIDIEWLIERAWDEIVSQNEHLGLKRINRNGESADFKFCRICIEKVLDAPPYNPQELKVLDVEKRFDISMPGKIWKTPQGQFRITGYIDLVHEIDDNTIEIVDWKTGKRSDYGSTKPKDFYDILKDAQPRIYHFAASQLYPKYSNVIVTFYYINDGGPIMLPYSQDDMIMTVGAIWRVFKKIQNDSVVTRNITWRCPKFCQFGRMNVCDSAWADMSSHGFDFISQKYGKMSVVEQQTYKEQA